MDGLGGPASTIIGPRAPPWPRPSISDEVLWQDHLPTSAERWFVVADGRGRVDWSFTSDGTTKLHVLVCQSTPPGYLQRLRELGVVHSVDVITLPGLVGGSGTPTMMDGAPLAPDGLPIRLELSEVQVEGDAVRTRYRVRPLE